MCVGEKGAAAEFDAITGDRSPLSALSNSLSSSLLLFPHSPQFSHSILHPVPLRTKVKTGNARASHAVPADSYWGACAAGDTDQTCPRGANCPRAHFHGHTKRKVTSKIDEPSRSPSSPDSGTTSMLQSPELSPAEVRQPAHTIPADVDHRASVLNELTPPVALHRLLSSCSPRLPSTPSLGRLKSTTLSAGTPSRLAVTVSSLR